MYLEYTLSHHTVYLRSVLTLSSHILLGFQPVSSGFTNKIVDTFLFSPMRATYPIHHLNLLDVTTIIHIWQWIQITNLLVMQCSTASCYLLLLNPPKSPLHPVLEYPQPIFFPSCKAYIFSTCVKQSVKLLFSALNYVRLRWQMKEKNYEPMVPDIQQI